MNIIDEIKKLSEREDEPEVRVDLISCLSTYLINHSFSSKECREIRLNLTLLSASEDESKICYRYFRDLFRAMEVSLFFQEQENKAANMCKNNLVLDLLQKLYLINEPVSLNDLHYIFNDKNLISIISEMEDIGFIEKYTEGWMLNQFGIRMLFKYKNICLNY